MYVNIRQIETTMGYVFGVDIVVRDEFPDNAYTMVDGFYTTRATHWGARLLAERLANRYQKLGRFTRFNPKEPNRRDSWSVKLAETETA